MSFIWERSAHRFHSRYRESTVTETFKFIQSLKHRTARLVVSIHYDRWFDGLDLSALDSETQQDLLLQNLISSRHEKTN